MRRMLLSAVMALAIGAGAFAAEKIDPTRATAEGAKSFGFELFWAVKKKAKEPVALSPMSVTEAITLATNGAQGKTLEELEGLFISNMLRKAGGSVEMLNAGIENIKKSLADFTKKSKGSFEYSSANSLWANNTAGIKFQFTKEFKALADKRFGAKVEERDFAKVIKVKGEDGKEKEVNATVYEINQWVAKQTKDKIKELLTKLEPTNPAVILNAIYAKGKFKQHFGTITEGTYKGAGKPTKASFLTKEETINYYDDTKDAKIFSFLAEEKELDRDSIGNQIALDIIVPRSGKIADLAEKLDAEYYNDLVAKMKETSIKLTVPAGKVEMKDAAKLKEVLTDMPFDLKRAFSPKDAEFQKLGTVEGKKNIYIDNILTKTFYEVSPFGFEAAAATAVIFGREAAIFRPKAQVEVIDTPSIHVIRHIPSGMPLFIIEYDSPTLYKEADIVKFVIEGAKTHSNVTAEMGGGKKIVATYDEKSKSSIVAEVDKDYKILRNLGKIEK